MGQRAKRKEGNDDLVIAVSYEGKYYGVPRGEKHRLCCHTIPLHQEILHTLSEEKHRLCCHTIPLHQEILHTLSDDEVSQRRCNACGTELISEYEKRRMRAKKLASH